GLPDVKILGVLRGASNYTFLARLGPHPPSGLRAVYKPAGGESPLWDFEAGTLYQRQGAAYELGKVLGWPRRPPKVARRSARQDDGRVAPPCRGAHAQAPAARRDRPWLALPGADLGVVDPLAPGVTEPALVSFPGFMRLRRVLVAIPFWLLLFLLTAATGPSPTASPPPSPPPPASPSPS